MSDIIEFSEKQKGFDELYNNIMQIKANAIDANTMIVEVGRAGGKTEWFGKRLMDVAYDMPGELSFFAHKTYMALVKNIIPNLVSYYRTPRGESQRPLLREGIDFVIGEKDLPSHFTAPRFPILNPHHSMVFSNGHHIRLVSSDQPDSVAGANGVHAFIEEMKHNKGGKLKTRVFPALRGGTGKTRMSHYYQGITGVSDTARVDLGEDNWFEAFESLVNEELIQEIVTVALHVNRKMYDINRLEHKKKTETEIASRLQLQKRIDKSHRSLSKWNPILRQMRTSAIYYLRASSFVNKDFLGYNFFKTQMDSLTMDEFLAAIGSIRPKKVVDMFFGGFNNDVHTFDDGYIYKSIHDFNLKDTFKLTAEYLKFYDPEEPLIMGYDPGHFSSLVVAQTKRKENELRVIKEHFCWHPQQQDELARQVWDFFGPAKKNRRIILYYDRAGNKRKSEEDKITTDAKVLKRELESYGFRVELKNEKQRTIFYYEHYKLIVMMLSEKFKSIPRLRICNNECPRLVSAIHLSPIKRADGRIELDKRSEVQIALQHQAGLSTQIPSALMYLLFGLFGDKLPGEIKKTVRLPDNQIV